MLTACRTFALPLCLIALAACGDAASQDPQIAAARKYDQALTAARKALAEVAVADPAANRASAEALRSAANGCKAPSGASNAQKAGFSLTAAQLLREAARLDTVAIERLQAQQRSAADQVLSGSGSVAMVQKLAGSLTAGEAAQAEGIQKELEAVQAEIAELDAALQAAQGDMQSHQAESKELSDKAADLSQQAAAKRTAAASAPRSTDAEKLIREASDLTQQAIERRHAAGAASQVVQARTPETALLQRRLETLKAKQQGLEQDRDLLAAVSASRAKAKQDLSASSGSAAERVRNAAAALEKVSDELKPLLASAGESLEQAASLAQQGGSMPGPQGSSAKMSAASAHLAQAMLNERAVIGASLQAAAFEAYGKSTGESKWSKLAEEARKERGEAAGRALTALEAAEGDLGGDAAPSLVSLKARIAEAKKSYESMKPAAKPAEPAKADEGAKPASEPKAESAPAGEAPKTDAPASDAPKSDAPAADAPKPDAPPAQPAPGR